jgi:hypothetical protein
MKERDAGAGGPVRTGGPAPQRGARDLCVPAPSDRASSPECLRFLVHSEPCGAIAIQRNPLLLQEGLT